MFLAPFLAAEPNPDEITLRVLTLNLHTYQEADAVAKLDIVAAGIAAMRADAVAFQEAGVHLHDAAKPNAGEVIRKRLESLTGHPWFHEWREAHIGFDEYREGLSVLSRVPIHDVREYELSGGGLRRIALAGTMKLDGHLVRLCSAHVSWPSAGGDTEAGKLLAYLDADEPTTGCLTILAGDFNAQTRDPQIVRILAAGYADAGAVAGCTGGTMGDPPTERIDYQFLRASRGHPMPKVRSVRRVFLPEGDGSDHRPRVSDHAGVMAEYVLSSEPPRIIR